MAKVSIGGLGDAIAGALAEYSQEVAQEVFSDVEETAKKCRDTLQQNSPKDSGDYAESWRVRKAYSGEFDIRVQVHNKDRYQLTHLLNDGHAKVNGGRVEGDGHITKARDEAERNLHTAVKVGLSK